MERPWSWMLGTILIQLQGWGRPRRVESTTVNFPGRRAHGGGWGSQGRLQPPQSTCGTDVSFTCCFSLWGWHCMALRRRGEGGASEGRIDSSSRAGEEMLLAMQTGNKSAFIALQRCVNQNNLRRQRPSKGLCCLGNQDSSFPLSAHLQGEYLASGELAEPLLKMQNLRLHLIFFLLSLSALAVSYTTCFRLPHRVTENKVFQNLSNTISRKVTKEGFEQHRVCPVLKFLFGQSRT